MARKKEYDSARSQAREKTTGNPPALEKSQGLFQPAPTGQKPVTRPAPLDPGGSGGSSLDDQ